MRQRTIGGITQKLIEGVWRGAGEWVHVAPEDYDALEVGNLVRVAGRVGAITEKPYRGKAVGANVVTHIRVEFKFVTDVAERK